MSADLMPFAFDDALVRIHLDDQGEPWFVAKDVCRVLELENSNLSRQGYLEDDEKGLYNVQTPGGLQKMLTVSESGLYALVFKSRKPEARRFRKWVTAEVLPSLRRTGRFAVPGRPEVAHKPPLELPTGCRRLRPGLRASVLSAAVQAAKMENGGADCIKAFYVDFCELVSGPAPGLPGQDSVEAIVERWAAENLEPYPGNKVQAKILYAHCRAWCAIHAVAPPTLPRFGRYLRESYRFHDDRVVWYLDIRIKPAPAGKSQTATRPPDAEDERITVTRAARELGVSRSTVYRMVEEGTLRSVKVGRGRGGLRVLLSSVEERLKGSSTP